MSYHDLVEKSCHDLPVTSYQYQTLCNNSVYQQQFDIDWNDLLNSYGLTENILNFDFENQDFKDFFNKIKNLIDWKLLSTSSKLNENFIRKYQDKICWNSLKYNTNIIYTEDFILDFADLLDVTNIVIIQNLSVDFIKKVKDYIDWTIFEKYYYLNENFIEIFIDYLNIENVLRRMNFSNEFIDKHKSIVGSYVLNENEKMKQVLNHGYTIIGRNKEKWIECYKAVRQNYASIFAYTKYVYDKLDYIYETQCNYCILEENSHGFGCWTREDAIWYAKGSYKEYRLIKVIIPLKETCILENGKLRSSKLIVIDLNP